VSGQRGRVRECEGVAFLQKGTRVRGRSLVCECMHTIPPQVSCSSDSLDRLVLLSRGCSKLGSSRSIDAVMPTEVELEGTASSWVLWAEEEVLEEEEDEQEQAEEEESMRERSRSRTCAAASATKE
jgi:hypothetical protein